MKSMNPLWKANSYNQDINNMGDIKIFKKKNNNLRKLNWIGYCPACNIDSAHANIISINHSLSAYKRPK